jgi:hypothetical protein
VVDVDPAGRNQEARGVDLAPGRSSFATDRGDPTAPDRHVAPEGRPAGPIDDGAAANDDVVHWTFSCD